MELRKNRNPCFIDEMREKIDEKHIFVKINKFLLTKQKKANSLKTK